MSQTTRATKPARKLSGKVEAGLPPDVFEVVVAALAEALVLDYQQDADAMVNSPRGKDHEFRKSTA